MKKSKKTILLRSYFDIENVKVKLKELLDLTVKEDFWNDPKKAESILSTINQYKSIIEEIEDAYNDLIEKKEIIYMLKSEYDEELFDLVRKEIDEIIKIQEQFEIKTLLGDEFDKSNCILEIHSGAGGVEACDWANMLYRMYTRWCERNKYKYEELYYQKGEEAGLKSASLLIKGIYSYGYLKGEKGIHRLVRLSPFDSNNKRHTSFASVDITPELDQSINIEIKEEDLKIDVYRSGGAGGQSVNTTDSAVRITHIPTGIVVTCQNERSQIQNKEKALNILKNKLYINELENKENELSNLKGTKNKIDFGSQIRSYVIHPYSMVKDHRTDYETSNIYDVLDGEIDEFIHEYLKGEKRYGSIK
ncbi:MAG: peptide chain release factor 2 [Tenericutes bacterium]|nr:peptide chain release factor 2 [Mycoplasmatota bacterium]